MPDYPGHRGLNRNITRALYDLSSTFSWEFSEVKWRLDEQSRIWEGIHETLKRPLETIAIERRNHAIELDNNELYPEALEHLREAEIHSKISPCARVR